MDMDYFHSAFEIDGSVQGGPVYLAALGLLNSEWFFWLNYVLGIVLSFAFLAYCLSREGRDERGRALIGTACIYGAVALFILMNLLGHFSITAMTNLAIFSNCLHLVYNGYFIAVLAAIAILRKIR